MRHLLRSLVFTSSALWATGVAASPFYAPPPPKEDTPEFSGDAELGFTHLSGNTDSQTLIGKTRLTSLTGQLTHSLRGEVRNVSKDGETSAEQYLLAGRESAMTLAGRTISSALPAGRRTALPVTTSSSQ